MEIHSRQRSGFHIRFFFAFAAVNQEDQSLLKGSSCRVFDMKGRMAIRPYKKESKIILGKIFLLKQHKFDPFPFNQVKLRRVISGGALRRTGVKVVPMPLVTYMYESFIRNNPSV